jgi:hypothetical protein
MRTTAIGTAIGGVVGILMFLFVRSNWANLPEGLFRLITLVNGPAWLFMNAWVNGALPVSGDFGWVDVFHKAIVGQWILVGACAGIVTARRRKRKGTPNQAL